MTYYNFDVQNTVLDTIQEEFTSLTREVFEIVLAATDSQGNDDSMTFSIELS